MQSEFVLTQALGERHVFSAIDEERLLLFALGGFDLYRRVEEIMLGLKHLSNPV